VGELLAEGSKLLERLSEEDAAGISEAVVRPGSPVGRAVLDHLGVVGGGAGGEAAGGVGAGTDETGPEGSGGVTPSVTSWRGERSCEGSRPSSPAERMYSTERMYGAEASFGTGGRRFGAERMYSSGRSEPGTPVAQAGVEGVEASGSSGFQESRAERLGGGEVGGGGEALEEVVGELLAEGSKLLERLSEEDAAGISEAVVRPGSPVGRAVLDHLCVGGGGGGEAAGGVGEGTDETGPEGSRGMAPSVVLWGGERSCEGSRPSSPAERMYSTERMYGAEASFGRGGRRFGAERMYSSGRSEPGTPVARAGVEGLDGTVDRLGAGSAVECLSGNGRHLPLLEAVSPLDVAGVAFDAPSAVDSGNWQNGLADDSLGAAIEVWVTQIVQEVKGEVFEVVIGQVAEAVVRSVIQDAQAQLMAHVDAAVVHQVICDEQQERLAVEVSSHVISSSAHDGSTGQTEALPNAGASLLPPQEPWSEPQLVRVGQTDTFMLLREPVTSVKVVLRLDMRMADVRGNEQDFCHALVRDVATSLGVPTSKCHVLKLQAGSILVTLGLEDDVCSERGWSAMDVAHELVRQAFDPSAPLRDPSARLESMKVVSAEILPESGPDTTSALEEGDVARYVIALFDSSSGRGGKGGCCPL